MSKSHILYAQQQIKAKSKKSVAAVCMRAFFIVKILKENFYFFKLAVRMCVYFTYISFAFLDWSYFNFPFFISFILEDEFCEFTQVCDGYFCIIFL